MPRGGRGGFGGGRGGKKGPDMSWDDEESTEVVLDTRKPGPLFPDRHIPVPKPLSPYQKASVQSFIDIRDRVRRGPLHAIIDPTILMSAATTTTTFSQSNRGPPTSNNSKSKSRAGFDPFNDQEKYTMRYHRKVRTIADLGQRAGYTLRLFPPELWSVLDPKHKMAEWQELTEEQKTKMFPSSTTAGGKKRKRETALKFDDEDDSLSAAKRRRRRGNHGGGVDDDDDNNDNHNSEASDADITREEQDDDDDDNDDDDDDESSSRRKRKKRVTRRKTGAQAQSRGRRGEKKGFEAEDDYPDVDQQQQEDEGDGAVGAEDDEPGDSEFGTDEEEDEGMDDYNAEQYFDDGADDVDGGGDGDEDAGGYY